MQQAFDALNPLRAALEPLRSVTARAVAADRDAAALAFLTAILRWPDRQQPMSYIKGFPVIGDIEASGVFRAVTPPALVGCADHFLW